jgi:hypothetical protein
MHRSVAQLPSFSRAAPTSSAAAASRTANPPAASACACGGGCPRCTAVRSADPPTAGAPAPPSAAPAAAAQGVPKFLEGAIKINDGGSKARAETGVFEHFNSFSVDSPFDVSTSGVKIEEPPKGMFQYGLVQNLFFHHLEQRYAPHGDMLVDSVGPFVDVWFTETPPFFHESTDNPVLSSPGLFGSSTTVVAKYSDKPGVSFSAKETACNERVALKSARNSLEFRAGLVARDMNNPATLIHLASTSTTYGYWWNLQVDKPGEAMDYHIDTSPAMSGTYTLSASAPAVVLSGKRAVEDINEKRDAEKLDMASRCESVLDPPPLPLP